MEKYQRLASSITLPSIADMTTDIAGLLLTFSLVFALIGPRLTGIIVQGKPWSQSLPLTLGFYSVVALGVWLSFEIYLIP